eukprot:TRINITY_DN1851_c0_g1_i3.p1 TRINITY_DN1851_c0_g1~~TRINITY_DN1851_c0_g1_i3.p1  ORF type:complete len:177 (+),score=8.12 TRINITY_DN1851_c0_g1_i3:595-1125(+)
MLVKLKGAPPAREGPGKAPSGFSEGFSEEPAPPPPPPRQPSRFAESVPERGGQYFSEPPSRFSEAPTTKIPSGRSNLPVTGFTEAPGPLSGFSEGPVSGVTEESPRKGFYSTPVRDPAIKAKGRPEAQPPLSGPLYAAAYSSHSRYPVPEGQPPPPPSLLPGGLPMPRMGPGRRIG